MWKRFLQVFSLAILCYGPSVHALSPRRALDRFVKNVHTFQAEFTQIQISDSGAVVGTQSGEVWLSRPKGDSTDDKGKFRWSYQKPYKQLIVNDGEKIWIFDPDLKQVTVRYAQEALVGSPAALLSQGAALTAAFHLEADGATRGLQVVRLIPKSRDSDFNSIVLSLRQGIPVRMVFRDKLGDTTRVRFSEIRTNIEIPAKLFTFTPPAGVDVVRTGGRQSSE